MASERLVTVLGGGSFGTALASIVANNGYATRLWVRDPELAVHINQQHRNPRYLSDLVLPESIQATASLQQALEGAELVFLAIPSKGFAQVLDQALPYLHPDQLLVSTTKGFEEQGFRLMSQVMEQKTGFKHLGVLSGPNLAGELAQKQLTATVIASPDDLTRATVQQVLGNRYFRVYANTDMYGAELGGALKNIYAIAAGMASALGMGENTRSMLMTRALAEMSRFAVSLGANPMTFLGLSGVGDLIVTCSSPLSRNFRVGQALGRGQSLDQIVASLGQVAEGVNTVRLVKHKADEMGIYMPLVQALYLVLFEGHQPTEVAGSMMGREQSTDVEFVLPHDEVVKSARNITRVDT
ncbi:NAD(P)H-dependent glycerol-3-phosphate dehydrogenase [Marinospirillum alkaliphilum]|uniref:Glycerol-3-phosphate dehydrogenase [NAD(P)+] n=1 Tax=Marinospirillum alkaliphilum DSM 21637 TaxID=1122209 RepID=A0A1K1U2I1_9GAMM|nr:NAD(P)H-dependent glycerol-3-phosphate dehydrogenase [Marinospirillum alkaliphilum]SFX06587.1 glycerol 3-phosphate dehydrogenase (NAD(P)+) [Marinospirillum alkaliphilum DSM 21637]